MTNESTLWSLEGLLDTPTVVATFIPLSDVPFIKGVESWVDELVLDEVIRNDWNLFIQLVDSNTFTLVVLVNAGVEIGVSLKGAEACSSTICEVGGDPRAIDEVG